MKGLRRYFLAGVATLLPLSVTVFVFWFIIVRLGNLFNPVFRMQPWLARHVPDWGATLAGFVFFVLVVLLVGWIASGLIGKLILGWIDKLMRHMPIVKIIYSSARQFTDAIMVSRDTFRKTVIVEYPRVGMFAIGFLTSEERIPLADGRNALFVFIPTTPTPTSGWLALIPEDEVIGTSMTIEAGLKLIVTGGVIKPSGFGTFIRPKA